MTIAPTDETTQAVCENEDQSYSQSAELTPDNNAAEDEFLTATQLDCGETNTGMSDSQ